MEHTKTYQEFKKNGNTKFVRYAEYKKALDNLNDRMCRELGLYYDSNYNLVIKKKDNSK